MRERENGGGISSRLKLEHQLKHVIKSSQILLFPSISLSALTWSACQPSVCVSVNVICKENNGLVEDRLRIPRTTSQGSTISFSQSVKLLASCGGELEKNRVQIHIRTVVWHSVKALRNICAWKVLGLSLGIVAFTSMLCWLVTWNEECSFIEPCFQKNMIVQPPSFWTNHINPSPPPLHPSLNPNSNPNSSISSAPTPPKSLLICVCVHCIWMEQEKAEKERGRWDIQYCE